MTKEVLRFGIVGLGGIGSVRAQALQQAVNCTLTAVCDIDPNKTTEWKSNVEVFADFAGIANYDKCDALVICTPPDTHREMATAAMRAGKHVLVEKPMAESKTSCEEMLSVARETGRVLTVGYNHRFFKGVDVVRRSIVEGAIGNLHFLRAYTGHTGLSEFKAPWMYDRKVMGGGTLADNGTHLLDLVSSLMGDINSVDARVDNTLWNLEVEDNAFLRMTDINGAYCEFHSSWTEWKGYRFFIEAYGDKGMVQMYYAPMFARRIRMADDRLSSTTERWFFWKDIFKEKVRGWQSTVIETFLKEFDEFFNLVNGKVKSGIIATGEDGYRAVQLANAAYESSKMNTPIAVAQSKENN